MTTAAQAAKAIRIELKAKFPAIKFSVRSENFAGGDAVSIRYDDGVPTKEVEAVVGKYQYGHFDGMIDLYENSNVREDIPQAKYVQVSREISKENLLKVQNQIMADFGIQVWNDENVMKALGVWPQQAIWREAYKLTF